MEEADYIALPLDGPSTEASHNRQHPKNKTRNSGLVKSTEPNLGSTLKRKKLGSLVAELRKKTKQEGEKLYPGPAPIDKKQVERFQRKQGVGIHEVKGGLARKRLSKREQKYSDATRLAARSKILIPSSSRRVETPLTQVEIVKSVDVTSATKRFDLKLNQFGPYKARYTRNGRYLLLAGAKGHCACIDWQTARLMKEMNVMERVRDATFLHNELMFAVAQDRWTYVYDNQGIELHCLKNLDRALRLEFLPHHFLLASGHENGFLCYMDMSVGKEVGGSSTREGRLSVMAQNSSNAIIHLGHTRGTVSLWSPNVKEPLVKMFAHKTALTALDVDNSGNYMVTTALDDHVKIWDLRMYKAFRDVTLPESASTLEFSQTRMLAIGLGNTVQMFNDPVKYSCVTPALSHRLPQRAASVAFCPYEDVLAVGHGAGVCSLLAPGSAEANYDALANNPYANSRQRQEAEVRLLMEKLPADTIALDPAAIGEVNYEDAREKMTRLEKIAHIKPHTADLKTRRKTRGLSAAKRREVSREASRREQIATQKKEYDRTFKRDVVEKSEEVQKPDAILGRFKKSSK